MNRHTINEGFGAPHFSARARVAFGSGITPLADRDVSNTSATELPAREGAPRTLSDQVGTAVIGPRWQVKNCKTGAMSQYRDSSERRQ